MSELLQPLRNQNPFIASSPHMLPHPSTFVATPSFSMPPRVGHQHLLPNRDPREIMAHRRLPMPSLQHQPSRTVIDLTEEADLPSSQSQHRRSSQRSAAPPQLERSDSISLGQEVITIDSDDDDEVEFVSQHPLTEAARQRNRTAAHPAHGPQVLHQLPPIRRQNHPGMPPRPPRQEHFFAAFGAGDVFNGVGRMALGGNNFLAALGFGHDAAAPPRMPDNMDYGQHPFPREPPKDQFQPPPPAKEGFTRSPKEDDIVVCPACDEELAVNPMDTEPGPEKKLTARKKSKADRAEHPFWVVRECGHVGFSLITAHLYYSNSRLLGLLQ